MPEEEKMTTAFPTSTSEIDYLLTSREGRGESLTIFAPGSDPLVAIEGHRNYQTIKAGVIKKELTMNEIRDLLDLSIEAESNFKRVSDRVTVESGRVYFDGDEIDNSITDHIVRCMEANLEDYKPLVNFLEKVAQNPTEHSREQLYEWLKGRDFTITSDGDFIAYKGVKINDNDEYVSLHHGPAIVDGTSVNGAVPNPPGAVVEMGRSQVAFDPNSACSTGLHVGTYDYAHQYAHGGLLKVKVNPRDVVSVPHDHAAAKMRVCRYQVLQQIDAPETVPVAFDEEDGFWPCRYYCPNCDEYYSSEDVCLECGEPCEEEDFPADSSGMSEEEFEQALPKLAEELDKESRQNRNL